MNRRIIIATGGTGGHIFPAQAICDYIKDNKLYVPQLICDKRALPFLSGSLENIERIVMSMPAQNNNGIKKIFSIAYLARDVFLTLAQFIKVRPKMLISFGGYPTFPAMVAATALFIPIIVHEQNAVVGKVIRWFLPSIKKITTAMPNPKGIQNHYKFKKVFIGNFLRKKISLVTDRKNHDSETFNIMVIGGSQGAKFLSEIVPKALKLIPKELQEKIMVWQQARKEEILASEHAYKGFLGKYEIREFFNDIDSIYQKSNIAICRAGASTISELIATQLPAILIPYPYATDNHQYFNAKYLVDNSAALMYLQQDLTAEKLAESVIDLLNSRNKTLDISQNLAKLQTPNSIVNFIKILGEI